MSEIQVASRYAKSLIDLAEEQSSLESIREDIKSFIKVCKENSQFLAVLRNPIINPGKKIAILNTLFEGRVNSLILAFFKIMVNKGRSQVLYPTAKEFINEYNRRKGIVNATVTSATSLSDENKLQLIQVIKEATKGEVVLETKVDPELIGGFVLKVGDRQFDASIANSLQKLKKEFAQKVAY
jgi:F-type H+-transporting ATPase subunit delta